jgi:hypothetical protein
LPLGRIYRGECPMPLGCGEASWLLGNEWLVHKLSETERSLADDVSALHLSFSNGSEGFRWNPRHLFWLENCSTLWEI